MNNIKFGSRVTRNGTGNGIGVIRDLIAEQGEAPHGAWVKWPDAPIVMAPLSDLQLVKTSHQLTEELHGMVRRDDCGGVIIKALDWLNASWDGDFLAERMVEIIKLKQHEQENTHVCDSCGGTFMFSETCPEPVPSAGEGEVCGGEPYVYVDEQERFTPQEF